MTAAESAHLRLRAPLEHAESPSRHHQASERAQGLRFQGLGFDRHSESSVSCIDPDM